jgi:hypothetical protein
MFSTRYTQMQKLKDYEIKLIIDALHRDAQRCDNMVEQCLSSNKETNIHFFIDKSSKLRDIANNLIVGNNTNIVSDSEIKFAGLVKVISPRTTMDTSIKALPPPNKETAKKIAPASRKKTR